MSVLRTSYRFRVVLVRSPLLFSLVWFNSELEIDAVIVVEMCIQDRISGK
jgi:hypothetical protein